MVQIKLMRMPDFRSCITATERDMATDCLLSALASVLRYCCLGGRKGIRPVKNWAVGCWQLMPLPLTVSCFNRIQIGFTFLVPAHLGSPGQRAVKQVCVLPVWCRSIAADVDEVSVCFHNLVLCFLSVFFSCSKKKMAWVVNSKNALYGSQAVMCLDSFVVCSTM